VLLPSEDLIPKLYLNPKDHILRLRCLRFADNIPIVIEISNIPLSQFPGLDHYDFSNQSLYHVLRKQYGVRIGWADEIIEAVPATSEETKLLKVARGSSILSITRLVMTTDEQPVEAACSRYRGDRYRASIRVNSTDMNGLVTDRRSVESIRSCPSTSGTFRIRRQDTGAFFHLDRAPFRIVVPGSASCALSGRDVPRRSALCG